MAVFDIIKVRKKMDEAKIRKLTRGLRDVAQKFVTKDALDVSVVYMAYMLHRNSIENGRYLTPYDLLCSRENLPDDVAVYVKGLEFADYWPELAPFIIQYSNQDFVDAVDYMSANIVNNPMEAGTPNGICQLTVSLLELKRGDHILDVGSGGGNFLMHAIETPKSECIGIDTNPFAVMISQLRLAIKKETLTNPAVSVIRGDIFDKIRPESGLFEIGLSRKVFSNYPFVARAKALGAAATNFIETLGQKLNLRKKVYSSDWLFNGLLCDLMGNKGRAVAIMSAGSTWKENDEEVRGAIVASGLVECVIELPAGAIPGTAVNTCLIVFSHGNKTVRFVNANQIGTKSRTSVIFNDYDVQQILEMCKSATPISKEDLAPCGYCILPSRITTNNELSSKKMRSDTKIKVLGDFCKLSRGAIFSSADFEITESNEETGMRYLKPANIIEGEIVGEMANIDLSKLNRKVNENLYCAKEQTLVMTKYGSPTRIAIVRDSKQKLLVNSNLYMLNVNQAIALPDYVKLFLESSHGQSLIEKTLVGSVMQSIDQKLFMSIPVPLPSLNEQKSFVKKYMVIKAQLDKYKAMAEEIRTKANQLVDEEMGI